MTQIFDLFASCPKGLEELLAVELQSLGGEPIRQHTAGVSFRGDLATAYRCCLWSRLANRILMPLANFPVTSAEALYEGVAAVPWRDHFSPDATFMVDFNGTSAVINNSQFGAQKVKDAVVDHFVWRLGQRPSIDLRNPRWRLHVQLRREQATVSIDLAGDSLHRRGYRLQGGMAPLKENLAAALLLRADWPGIAARGGALLDPLCGSGTLLIEGALMAMDIAPGWARRHWAFEYWAQHDAKAWTLLREDAEHRRNVAMNRQWPEIRGYDASGAAVRAAEENIERAGLTGKVRVLRKELAQFVRPTHQAIDYGLVISNPPYGERLGEQESLRHLYGHFGERLRQEFTGWKAALFTGNPELGKSMGLRSFKQYRLWNGTIPAQLLLFQVEPQYFVDRSRDIAPARSEGAQRDTPSAAMPAVPLGAGAQMFANRLQKNRKRLQKWLKQEAIECYRLYDADMPEYAVAVDCYGDWVHVSEYAAPATVDPAAADARLRDVIAAIPSALHVEPRKVVLKQRSRQRGSNQYERVAQLGEFLQVREGDAQLLVNLTDYLDTGLFLDHRPVRREIAARAAGKSFLNLFCYTATAQRRRRASTCRRRIWAGRDAISH
jgi:23S rRNA (guanine2445-N2)-methyltransferase / 23S rRNA (guanine2069-N7)-methyltransferase